MSHRWTTTLVAVVLSFAVLVTVDGYVAATRYPRVEIGQASVEVADQPPGTEAVRYDGGIVAVANYLVVDRELVGTGNGTVAPEHRHLWSLVSEVLPSRYVDLLRQFSVVEEHPYDVVAVVHQSVEQSGRWILTVDQADAANREVLVDTIVHELAHLITLGSDVFTFRQNQEAACAGRSISLGCAADGSLIAAWAERFWDGVDEPTAPDPDMFVTEYAATSVHEDLAESFTAWVRHGSSDGATMAAAKLRFFDGYPELVAVREELQPNL